MPQIVPIKDLKNTAESSAMCHRSNDPVFITKNGYGDMVIMSMEAYERAFFMLDVQQKLMEAKDDVAAGRTLDAESALQKVKEAYGLQAQSDVCRRP